MATVLAGCTLEACGNDDSGGVGFGIDAAIASGAGPTMVATGIPLTPDTIVSDGTSLYWVSGLGAGGPLSSMSVNGGAIGSVVPGPIGSGFLAVDDVNAYYEKGGIFRVPKAGGGVPTLVNDADAGSILGATVLGSTLYWIEGIGPGAGGPSSSMVMKSSPLQGGANSTVVEFEPPIAGVSAFAVTTTTAFVSASSSQGMLSFPLGTGAAYAGAGTVIDAPDDCQLMLSDTTAVYCERPGFSILTVNGGGTVASLGWGIGGGSVNVAFDDTYVYWVDGATSTIMRVPKTGGVAPTVLASATSPVAIAVDTHAIYWSDEGGNIWRLAK
jgi:hypothetical protein